MRRVTEDVAVARDRRPDGPAERAKAGERPHKGCSNALGTVGTAVPTIVGVHKVARPRDHHAATLHKSRATQEEEKKLVGNGGPRRADCAVAPQRCRTVVPPVPAVPENAGRLLEASKPRLGTIRPSGPVSRRKRRSSRCTRPTPSSAGDWSLAARLQPAVVLVAGHYCRSYSTARAGALQRRGYTRGYKSFAEARPLCAFRLSRHVPEKIVRVSRTCFRFRNIGAEG